MEQIENHMVIGDYYAGRERQYDPDVVTADDCRHKYKCGGCNLRPWCLDRKDVGICKLCGEEHTEDELYCGVCEDCLKDAIDPHVVREYVSCNAESNSDVWISLFDSYFYDSGDICRIERLSKKLRDTLMNQIVIEWNADRRFKKLGVCEYHAKDRLVAWVGADRACWEDFAEWLLEKKGAGKKC